jgi:hypothetical protein
MTTLFAKICFHKTWKILNTVNFFLFFFFFFLDITPYSQSLKAIQYFREEHVTSNFQGCWISQARNQYEACSKRAMFPLLLMLDSKEGHHRVQSLIDNHHDELCNKMKHYFASVSKQVYDWVRKPYSNIICSAREVDLKWRGRTLWAAVWLITQDEVY